MRTACVSKKSAKSESQTTKFHLGTEASGDRKLENNLFKSKEDPASNSTQAFLNKKHSVCMLLLLKFGD